MYVILDELRTVKDRKYGIENHDVKGNWDGMIGELIRKVWFQPYSNVHFWEFIIGICVILINPIRNLDYINLSNNSS